MPKVYDKIIVSNHVINRIRERFRLYFKDSVISNNIKTRYLVEKLIKEGREDVEFAMTPFYVNKYDSKHGGPSIRIINDFITFRCKKISQNEIMVLTCMINKQEPRAILELMVDRKF